MTKHEQDASDLSREAFASLTDKEKETIQNKVLFALSKRGSYGATDEELIAELAPIKQNSIAPARYALSRMKPPLVIKKYDVGGNRVFRMSTSDRRCQVWIVSDPKRRLQVKRVTTKITRGYACYEIDSSGTYRLIKNVFPTQYTSAKQQAEQWINSTPKGETT